MLRRDDSNSSLGSGGSEGEKGGGGGGPKGSQEKDKRPLPPPVLVYHESARSIVFRDHVRRVHKSMSSESSSSSSSLESSSVSLSGSEPMVRHGSSDMEPSKEGVEPVVVVANYTPEIDPLPVLDLGAQDEFEEWRTDPGDLSEAEEQVVELLRQERAVVKTVKNSDWTAFLRRFRVPFASRERRCCEQHLDQPPSDSASSSHVFNSFVTSTSLLPSNGRKMRCYGSNREYTTGVVFALPTNDSDEAVAESLTWCWPSGYAAKTEFNIDDSGHLINGREEALVSLSELRRHNHSYLHDTDYELSGRVVKGGLTTVPYNEVYLRVGGPGRIVNGRDAASGQKFAQDPRSFYTGVGLPIALFVRTACFGHLISLLRTRARMASVLGKDHVEKIPLLLLTPANDESGNNGGVRVLTESRQARLLQIVSHQLNPFQNPSLKHKTQWQDASESHLQEKYQELIDLDAHSIRQVLTPEECARLAGGFGATDDSVAHLLMDALQSDQQELDAATQQRQAEATETRPPHKLQDIVNEALASAVRASDYNTARQLLILYSLVASRGTAAGAADGEKEAEILALPDASDHDDGILVVEEGKQGDATSVVHRIPSRPPPPPLDTDRLRSATNSDGLLAVLGAAQTLRAMQDGGAQRRVEEAVAALEEWVHNGEQSVVFRLASWREQRVAQDDLQIAMEHDSNVLAFVSHKAVANRKKFATQLARRSADRTPLVFLQSLHAIIGTLHRPCLRLELLQYILGLDNRYSVAHVARSVELAATCMMIREEAVPMAEE